MLKERNILVTTAIVKTKNKLNYNKVSKNVYERNVRILIKVIIIILILCRPKNPITKTLNKKVTLKKNKYGEE